MFCFGSSHYICLELYSSAHLSEKWHLRCLLVKMTFFCMNILQLRYEIVIGNHPFSIHFSILLRHACYYSRLKYVAIVNNSNLVIFPLRQIISLRVVFPFWIDIIYLCALQTTKLILAYNSCLFRYESFTGMGLEIDDVVCPMWKSQFQHQAPNLWIVFND